MVPAKAAVPSMPLRRDGVARTGVVVWVGGSVLNVAGEGGGYGSTPLPMLQTYPTQQNRRTLCATAVTSWRGTRLGMYQLHPSTHPPFSPPSPPTSHAAWRGHRRHSLATLFLASLEPRPTYRTQSLTQSGLMWSVLTKRSPESYLALALRSLPSEASSHPSPDCPGTQYACASSSVIVDGPYALSEPASWP